MKSAVAIVSGGMDSATLAYRMRAQYDDLHLVSFDYGQRHKKELDYAAHIADMLNARWSLVDLTSMTELLTGSALTDDVEVPDGHYSEESMRATVVPNRNMVMLSIATSVAVARGAVVVAAGMHAGDHAVYPDCRPEFANAVNIAAQYANEGFADPDFRLEFPFIYVTKSEIAQIGFDLGVDFTYTWSCYKGGANHCGRCGTCVERAEAFHLAGIPDPTVYEDPNFWKDAVKA